MVLVGAYMWTPWAINAGRYSHMCARNLTEAILFYIFSDNYFKLAPLKKGGSILGSI